MPGTSTWWRHQMETFSALLAFWAGNLTGTGEIPAQRPVTPIIDVFFDRRLNRRLSKQSWGWWFETPSRPLWRHNNELHPTVSADWYQLLAQHCWNIAQYYIRDTSNSDVNVIACLYFRTKLRLHETNRDKSTVMITPAAIKTTCR